MKQERDDKKVMQDFKIRQGRQFFAIGMTLFFLIVLVLFHKHPDLLWEFSKGVVFSAQIVVVTGFICFSAFNWRCPSCNRYLGADINRRVCKRCGTKLQ
ncbi:MAG: hypothetical protein AB1442_12525 [Nitrospirota bacterium]